MFVSLIAWLNRYRIMKLISGISLQRKCYEIQICSRRSRRSLFLSIISPIAVQPLKKGKLRVFP